MKVLVLADEVDKKYYDFYRKGVLDSFDLIIGCGDLPKSYLEFIVTMAHCPLIYVRGNHDQSYKDNPPEGCICIEDELFVYKGIRFLGLGGSYKYRDGLNMYTESDMKRRIRKLSFKLFRHKGFDVLVSHAPIYSNGMDDMAHRGFQCFEGLLSKYKPRYMFHGHLHKTYGYKIPLSYTFQDTKIYNAYESIEMEV